MIEAEEALPAGAPRCASLAAAEALYAELRALYKAAEAQAKALRGAAEGGPFAEARWGAAPTWQS
jgi:hypothetical protein